MSKIPSVEILNATHQFPCLYTYKAIGKAEFDFVGRVSLVIQSEMGMENAPSITTRQTADGKHVSVTIELRIASAEKVIALYEKILTIDGLVLLM